MNFILDTSAAIHLVDGSADTRRRLSELDGPILLSIVTRVELEGGVVRDPTKAGLRRARLDALLATMATLAFDDAAADAYRLIVETAGYSRRKVIDRMIAAQALVAGATVVTMNANDFADVPGLKMVAW